MEINDGADNADNLSHHSHRVACEKTLETIVGNAGDQAFHQARQAIGERLRKGGRPVNHDLQRAVRKAYLQATLYLCERCGEELKDQLGFGAQITHSFTPEIKGLIHLYTALGEELQQVGDDEYLLPANEADKENRTSVTARWSSTTDRGASRKVTGCSAN